MPQNTPDADASVTFSRFSAHGFVRFYARRSGQQDRVQIGSISDQCTTAQVDESEAQARAAFLTKEPPKKWFRVFAMPSMAHICDVQAENADNAYDPRIGGDGNVVWQECEAPQ